MAVARGSIDAAVHSRRREIRRLLTGGMPVMTVARQLGVWGIPGTLAGRAACVRRIAATLHAIGGAQNIARDGAVPAPRGAEKTPTELVAAMRRIAALEDELRDAHALIARLQIEVGGLRRSAATARKLAAIARR